MTKSAQPKRPTSGAVASKRLDLLQARLDTLAAGLADMHQTDLRELRESIEQVNLVIAAMQLQIRGLQTKVYENP